MVLLLLNRCPSHPSLCLETYPGHSLWSMAGLPPRGQPKATFRSETAVGRLSLWDWKPYPNHWAHRSTSQIKTAWSLLLQIEITTQIGTGTSVNHSYQWWFDAAKVMLIRFCLPVLSVCWLHLLKAANIVRWSLEWFIMCFLLLFLCLFLSDFSWLGQLCEGNYFIKQLFYNVLYKVKKYFINYINIKVCTL